MIDSRAVISPKAKIGKNVTIGAFSVIGDDVEIGDGSWIGNHVVISGPTTIGKENKIYHFCSIGEAPQDKKYNGEATRLEIGDRNLFREYCTVNRGTTQDRGVTTIGNDNWIMAYCHIAHDCIIGNDCTMSNSSSLAGHVRLDDKAILGGFVLVHQFCSIGSYCFCSFGSVINMDVPPYVTVSGHLAEPRGINAEGLKRSGFTPARIRMIKNAYKKIYYANMRLEEALEWIRNEYKDEKDIELFTSFIEASDRGIIR